MPGTTLDSDAFIAEVQPMLQRRDVSGLLHLLKTRWSCEQLEFLVDHGTLDAKKVAALALGLVGPVCCAPGVARLLRDPDPMLNRMAEHALWSIWFRASCDAATHQLCRGAQAIDRGDYDHAISHFNAALAIDPNFAEAWNQRAIAYYYKEDYHASIVDSDQAIRLMPCHFGAWSGKGHCHAHLGQLDQALHAYRKALDINPHLECIRESVQEIEKRMKD